MATTNTPTMGTRTDARTVWALDPSHTLAEFAVKHMMFTTVKGRFTGVRGTLVFDEDNPSASSVEAEIDVTTVDTGEPKRDEHLRSADFFDAERYPHLTFKSKSVRVTGNDTAKITGDLTIHGVTREVTLDVAYNGRGVNPWGMEAIGFTAQTTINRRDYGLKWNVPLQQAGGMLVGDDVKITLEAEAIKQN